MTKAFQNKRDIKKFIFFLKLNFVSDFSSLSLYSGPEILKKSRPKKLVKSNKSISRNFFFGQIAFFCNFKNSQKSILQLGKSLKPPKMQFYEKRF